MNGEGLPLPVSLRALPTPAPGVKSTSQNAEVASRISTARVLSSPLYGREISSPPSE